MSAATVPSRTTPGTVRRFSLAQRPTGRLPHDQRDLLPHAAVVARRVLHQEQLQPAELQRVLVPRPQILENLQRTFTYDGGMFPRWVLNSILYSGAAALIGTLLAVSAGYVLGKFAFRGKGLVFGATLAGVLVPNALLTIPLYFVASAVGLINSPWAVIIPTCVSPFGVYLARIYTEQSIPDEPARGGAHGRRRRACGSSSRWA